MFKPNDLVIYTATQGPIKAKFLRYCESNAGFADIQIMESTDDYTAKEEAIVPVNKLSSIPEERTPMFKPNDTLLYDLTDTAEVKVRVKFIKYIENTNMCTVEMLEPAGCLRVGEQVYAGTQYLSPVPQEKKPVATPDLTNSYFKADKPTIQEGATCYIYVDKERCLVAQVEFQCFIRVTNLCVVRVLQTAGTYKVDEHYCIEYTHLLLEE